MIDTLNISLSSESLLIPSLEGVRTIQSDWGTTMSGYYRNLYVKQRNDLVTISGSLQKYNRSQTLSEEESKRAILNLCEAFSFEPAEARVRRVDFAMNIKTQFEPKIYYPFLGSHQHYFRSPYKHSLNYHNSLRVLSFYDKAKESGISGNLLRYEQRYLKPEKVFNKKLMLVDLLTEEVNRNFLDKWRTDYSKIQKIKTLIPMENFKNPTQFFNYLIAVKATEIGSDLLGNQIKIAQRSGHLTKQNAKRIRDKMNRLSKSSFFECNELINELDEKILKKSLDLG